MPPAWITVKTNKSQHLNSISPIKHFNELDYWIWHKTHLAGDQPNKNKKNYSQAITVVNQFVNNS